jgi:hypothetical protein
MNEFLKKQNKGDKKMMKIFAALLAVLMLVTCFAACGEKKPPETTPNANQGIPKPDETPKNPDSSGSKPDETPKNPDSSDNKPDDNTPEEIVFEDVNETVYVTADTLTLRTSTDFDTETNIKSYVDKGAALKRTGYHKDWSRIELEGGEIVYCASKYVTTTDPDPEIPFTFIDVTETVFIDTTPNAQPDGTIPTHAKYYTFPNLSEDYYKGSLAFGATVERTGVYYEPVADGATDEGLGWSRIVIEGETFYIRNSNISMTDPNGADSGTGSETPDTNETPTPDTNETPDTTPEA